MAILGIDEVGRGPWAGPLVVGAVVLANGGVEGLTDSKKLTAIRRKRLSNKIDESGAGVGLGWVTAGEIDEVGLGKAMRLAVRRAVERVEASFHEIVIDGTVNFLAGTGLERHVTVLKKADLLVSEVSAASIVAKVARDEYMVKLAEKYPEYGFEKHMGYGTAMHLDALRKYGPVPEHRLSFRPVAEAAKASDFLPSDVLSRVRPSLRGAGAAVGLEIGVSGPSSARARQSKVCRPAATTQIGNKAEGRVAEYLRGQGQRIVARNWKTKFCEIDIVSRKGEHVYFTEVKYRYNSGRGDGLEAITSEKQRQMKFAAESYMKFSGLEGSPVLAVGAVSGEDFKIDDWFIVV